MKKSLAAVFCIGCLLTGASYAAVPEGWFLTGSKPADFTVGSEPGTRTPGSRNAFILAKKDSDGFGALMQTINAADYRGKRVRLSGYLRTQNAGKGQMWMRIDGSKGVAGFDNMEQRPLQGDTSWQRCDIVLDVPADARDIAFGFFLSGKGEVWGDAFRLEVVGADVPVTASPTHPALPRAPVNLDFAQ
jgi:hypothetical protein